MHRILGAIVACLIAAGAVYGADNHRVLLGGQQTGLPAWVVNQSNPPNIEFDFANNRAWSSSTNRVVAPASLLTTTRATVGHSFDYASDANGNYQAFGANTPRITSNGLLVEESRINSIRNNSMQGAIAGADGVELLTNGNFAAQGAGWTVNTVSGGSVTFGNGSVTFIGDNADYNNYISQQVTGLVIGRSYVVIIGNTGLNFGFFSVNVGLAPNSSSMAGGGISCNGSNSTFPDRLSFVATATSAWVTVGALNPGGQLLNFVSVQDGERVTNGNFVANPINASQATVQNGWQWSNSSGTGTVTYATNQVTLTGDGTHAAAIFASIPTVSGTTYTITTTTSGTLSSFGFGTAIGGSQLGSVANVPSGTNSYQFTATGTTSWVSIFQSPATPSTVSNVSVKSAGVLPTNWSVFPIAGTLITVAGVGTESGLPYIDYQVTGTPTATGQGLLTFEVNGNVAIALGQTWTLSYFAKLQAGSFSGGPILSPSVQGETEPGHVFTEGNSPSAITPTGDSLGSQRFTSSWTYTLATTAGQRIFLINNTTNGTPVNMTVRVGAPMFELNPAVGGAVASAVTAASGSGGVNGTAVYSVGGGTCAVAPTLNVTWAAGVLTVNSVANVGSCSVFPSSPAALTYVSGTATGWTGATVTLTPANNSASGVATSPIITSSFAVTRAADTSRVTTPPVLGTTFTEYAKFLPFYSNGPSQPNQYIYSLSNNSPSPALGMVRFGGSNNGQIINGGGYGTTGASPQATYSKVALAYVSSGNQNYAFNGASGSSTNGSAVAGSSLTYWYIGTDQTGVEPVNGFVAQVALWTSQALSTGVLASITVPDPQFDLNFAGSSYSGMNGQTPASFFTVARAAPATAYAPDNNGNYIAFGVNTPRLTNLGVLIEETRTNGLRNSSMFGASPGTPGTLPTNWTDNGAWPQNGITRTVVGTGTENGIAYIDLMYTGTASSGLVDNMVLDGNTPSATAAIGQTWTASVFSRLVAGSYANLTGGAPSIYIGEWNGGSLGTTSNVFLTNGSSLGASRTSVSRTFTGTTTNLASALVQWNFASGQTYNFTTRLGWPQVEQNAGVPMTVASATLNAGGSGYTGASGTMTWSGANCTTNPVLNVTASGGIIQAGPTVNNAGVCSVWPAAAATTWTPGGGLSGGSGASFNLVPLDNSGQAFATSPIPTTSAAVTRNGDYILQQIPLGLGYATGSLGYYFTPINNAQPSFATIGGFSAALSFTNPLEYLTAAGSADIFFLSATGSSPATAGSAIAGKNKLLGAWGTGSGNSLISLNGNTVTGNLSAMPSGAINYFALGSAPWSSGNNYINGFISRETFWPANIPAANATAWTQLP